MRTLDEIAADLTLANEALERAEATYGTRVHAVTDRAADLNDARAACERLRLELRAALAASDGWPDPGRDS